MDHVVASLVCALELVHLVHDDASLHMVEYTLVQLDLANLYLVILHEFHDDQV